MKFTREEYISILTSSGCEKNMLVELFGPLTGLREEWEMQGASKEDIELSSFDFDYVDYTFIAASTGFMNDVKEKIIEENDEFKIVTDSMGRKTKLIKKSATLPLPLDYPVTDEQSWLKIKSAYEFDEKRINLDQIRKAKKLREEGHLILAAIPGGFDEPRQLMGEENLCFAYYDMPELIEDILNTISNTSLKVLDYVSDIITIDNLCIHEDMAGKSGPLIGPNLMEEFVVDYYKKSIDLLKTKGTKLFSLDTDGNCNSIIDSYINAGINVLYPMEPAAYMDIVESYKKYGNKLGYKGGIDKHVLRKSKNEIIRELEYKLKEKKPVIYGLDHRIPNGTPFENYNFYVNTARELLKREPIKKNTRHHRMAF